jgi:hypothetical protein
MVGFETSVESDPVIPEVESSLQGSVLEGSGLLCEKPVETDQRAHGTNVKLKCTSFEWISSWAPASKLDHGGRASLAYLKEQPKEDASVHVVL